MNKEIICQKCIHYFVTWEPSQPHGCRAYGFKSKQIPSVVVKESSGMKCNFYKLKNSSLNNNFKKPSNSKDFDYF